MSSLSMSQFGWLGEADTPPSPPPPPNAIDAYMRAKDRVAALTARMNAMAPMTGDSTYVSAPVTITPPEPVPVRTVSTNGDLAKLALVGIVSGLAVWVVTSATKKRRR